MASLRPAFTGVSTRRSSFSGVDVRRPRFADVTARRARFDDSVADAPVVVVDEPAGVPELMRFHSGNKLRGDGTFYVGEGFFDMEEFEAVTAIQAGTGYSLVVYSSVEPGAGTIVFTVRSEFGSTAHTITLTGAQRKDKLSIPAGVSFPDQAETCLQVVRSGGVPDGKASGSVKLNPD